MFLILCIFVADSTRTVYQRKLQRWLQYGPTPDTSRLESRPDELCANIAARLDMATVGDEPSVYNPLSANEAHKKEDISPVRISKSEVIPHGQPYSPTSAECSSESLSKTSNGLSDRNGPMKPITNNEPIATPG